MNKLIHPRCATTLLVVVLFAAAGVSADTGSTGDPEELKKIIEAQQLRLDLQQQELDAQKQLLQELLQRVETMTTVGTVTTCSRLRQTA